MKRGITLVAALVAVGLAAACAPPQVKGVRYVKLDGTPSSIAWCNSHPGGAPYRDPQGGFYCRIVP